MSIKSILQPFDLRFFLIFLSATNFCLGQSATIPANAIRGDFDGDGKQEYAWLTSNPKPQNKEEDFGECEGECVCIIHFSNKKIVPIKVPQCIDGDLHNEGDLNDDSSDELSLIPSWWTSCWMSCHVYTFQQKKWRKLVPSFSVYCSHIEDNTDWIRKVKGKSKTVEIQESGWKEESIVLKKQQIKVK